MIRESGFANSKGTKLYFEVSGFGDSLTLIQGSALDNRMWDSQFTEFAQHYQVIRYDVRGYGQSIPNNTHEKYSHHEDLLAILDHLGVESTHVLGLSMGGSIAIDFALTHPDKTDSLIPVSSVLGGYDDEYIESWAQYPAYSTKKRNSQKNEKRTVDVFKEYGLDAAKDHIFNDFKQGVENIDLLRRILDEYSGLQLTHPEINENEILVTPFPVNRLSELKMPTLIIVGQQDSRGIHGIATLIEQEVEMVRKVIIGNVGHMCSMQNSVEFNQIVLGFLSDL